MNMKTLTISFLIVSVVIVLGVLNVKELFVVGFKQPKCDESFREFLSKGFCGIIFFTHNMKSESEIRCMTEEARRHGVKIIAIDHEGTYINRFKYTRGFIPPNAMALGSANDENLAYLSGYHSAKTLRELGFNVDFAPVLDVNSNPMNPIIGVRSFWSEPERVAKLGIAFMKGLMDGGVLAVVKHYPGHGDTDTDSHTGLPVIRKSFDEFMKTDLSPFGKAIASGAPAVMTAHIIVEDWDSFPATMSGKILGYLRKNLKFDGIIFSDDMLMKAVWIFAKLRGLNPALEAFKAGVDVLTVSREETAEEFARSLEQALENGDIDPDNLEKSILRVEKIMGDLRVSPPRVYMSPEEVLREVARKSIAAWKGKGLEPGKYVLIYPVGFRSTPKGYMKSLRDLSEKLSKFGVKTTLISYDVRNPQIDVWSGLYDGVIVMSVDLFKYERSRDFIDKVIGDFSTSVLIAMRSPYDLMYLHSKPDRYVVTYDWSEYYPDPLSEVLVGRADALGEFVSKDLGGM